MNEDLGYTHRFIPPSDPDTRDTLLVLHGTGGTENDLVGIAQAIAPGAAILSPRGNVSENGSLRFFRRIAEGVFDPVEVRTRAEELAGFIRGAIDRYQLDAGRITALGYSNGANIASAVLQLDPSLLRGAILFRPMVVFEPADRPDLSGRTVLISAGRMDPIAPPSNVEGLAAQLRSAGAEVTLKWQLTGHNLAPNEMREAAEWVASQQARV